MENQENEWTKTKYKWIKKKNWWKLPSFKEKENASQKSNCNWMTMGNMNMNVVHLTVWKNFDIMT